ncbi:MAG: DUF6308 family protein [Actinomycetota bacterium]|nr:DUF6308 family protein [Actinomycetota bacterium]
MIASRISEVELQWFLERAETAPWDGVDPALRLADLDPAGAPEQYEAAVKLYDHFREPRRPGVSMAKISKVLHVKRPQLVPILDSRLAARYRQEALTQGQKYPNLQSPARARFWLAVREDLVRPGAREVLQQAREALRGSDVPEARLLAEVSDVRLLDILAWA